MLEVIPPQYLASGVRQQRSGDYAAETRFEPGLALNLASFGKHSDSLSDDPSHPNSRIVNSRFLRELRMERWSLLKGEEYVDEREILGPRIHAHACW